MHFNVGDQLFGYPIVAVDGDNVTIRLPGNLTAVVNVSELLTNGDQLQNLGLYTPEAKTASVDGPTTNSGGNDGPPVKPK